MITKVQVVQFLYEAAASTDQIGTSLLRLALITVLVWIGGLKFVKYEAEGIVPLVAHSPVMRFFYHHPVPEYRAYMSKEGELNHTNQRWHESNGTYRFSAGLGLVILFIAVLISLHPVLPQVATAGSFLLVLMACTTLSFLVTTPEAWVSGLGDSQHGFPYLSGVGRLIIKDVIMFAAAIVTMADSANTYLQHLR